MAECTALLMELDEPRWDIEAVLVSGMGSRAILVWGELTEDEVSDLDSWEFLRTLEWLGRLSLWWSAHRHGKLRHSPNDT